MVNRHRNRISYSVWLLLFILTGIFQVSWATELRGRIDTRNPYTGYFQPLPGAQVTIVNPFNGAPLSTTYTGYDGFYYFSNVPPGQYGLVINGMRNFPLGVPPMPAYDIPPILF